MLSINQPQLNNTHQASRPTFGAEVGIGAPLAKPIETVTKTLENSVETLTGKEQNKDHKGRNTAIAVASSVLVLSGLVALLNPKFSPKLVKKLEGLANKAEKKAGANDEDTLLSHFYDFCKLMANKSIHTIQFINNLNSWKDSMFKHFCTEKKEFLHIRNKSTRSVLKKIDNGIRKVLTRPYNAITNGFDKISRNTVLSKYKTATKQLDSLDKLILKNKDKLSDSEKTKIESLIAEIKTARAYFNKNNTELRMNQQGELMNNLERDFWSRYRSYTRGFSNHWTKKSEHINKNLNYWAEDILRPQKEKVNTNGNQAVEKLFGEGNSQKGLYDEITSILKDKLSEEDKLILDKTFNKARKSLTKANKSECLEYFDKKRDLTLGSAPTDILTAVIGLGAGGISISAADNRQDRVSRTLTGVFPVLGGLATSMIFTARLISGPVGMVAGATAGVILNKIGSFTNRYIFGNTDKEVQNV